MFLIRSKTIRPVLSIVNNITINPPLINRYAQFTTVKDKYSFKKNILLDTNIVFSKKYRLVHDDPFDHTIDITKNSSNENFDAILEADEDLEENVESIGLEDDIVEFFTNRVIPYEAVEGEGYFSAQCPVCHNKSNDKAVFVEKSSGVSFCPGCKFYGEWEDLVAKYDTEDYLTEDQLDDLLCSSNAITENQLELLNLTPFAVFDFKKLTEAEARINTAESHLIFPLKSEKDEVVGVASFSLIHPQKSFKAVYQVLEGRSGIFRCRATSRKCLSQAIVVSKISDCLALSKNGKREVICFTAVPSQSCIKWALRKSKTVYLWIAEQLNDNLASYCNIQKDFDCLLIPVNEHRQDIVKRSARSIGTAIAGAIPIFHTDIIQDHDTFFNEIFKITRKKEEEAGTKWCRYHMLNDILLGHRPGELTIFTGLTGSGKTTFMSEYSLDLCMQGVPTLWGSFEVDHIRLIANMLQQFIGSPLPRHLFQFKQIYNEFRRVPIYTLNFYGQQNITSVLNQMAQSIAWKGVKHVVIDNLQFMLGVNNKTADWWLEQDKAVGAFRNFATKFDCHVTLIVHPKKLQNGDDFGLNNISGGARVTQEADNVMILQTKMKRNADTFAPKTLQIVKNRYGGTLGEIKLTFHKESKTFSSFFIKSKTTNANTPYGKLPTDR